MDYVELYQRRPGILTVACGDATHTQHYRTQSDARRAHGPRKERGGNCLSKAKGGTASLWRLGLADLEAVRVDALALVHHIPPLGILIDAQAVVLVVDTDIANLFVARRRAGLGDGLLGFGLGRLARRLDLLEELFKLGVLLAGVVELVEELRHIGSRHVGRHDVENLLVDVQ